MIYGLDEVGRGAWAGPLLVAAVALPKEHGIIGLTDSKILSAAKRVQLSCQIMKNSSYIGLGWVRASEIDRVGLAEAMKLAVARSISGINESQSDSYIIDGSVDYISKPNSKAVIKAEIKHESVAAASIVAKVLRDQLMVKMSVLYPQYGFSAHVGYGTKQHQQALNQHGVTHIHRKSFRPIALHL